MQTEQTASDIETPTGDDPAATFTAAFKSLRERSRTLLRQQVDRLRELEGRLEQQFAAAVERLEQEPREIASEEQQLFDKVATLERELRHLQQLRRESEQALDEARMMLGELEEERRILRERLDDVEGRGGTAPAAAPAQSGEETERLSRRLEMAMQEIRDLKQQNTELAEQVKRPSSGSTSRPVESSTMLFDWESQKQRLLEQLASSFDTNDPVQSKEKIRCEEIIKTTDRVIAEKDREIAELRKQLEERPETAPAGPTREATESVLAADEMIQTERARLVDVQAQWQEKLRHAEIEISIERAKLARERLQMEEKLRLLAAQTTGDSPPAAGETKTPNRGRWLSRLGLSGDSEKG
jgi:hypothetical protein